MRLGWFDRIRRLAHLNRSTAATGNSPQGRHRRGQRGPSARGRPAAPGGWPAPSAPPEPLLRTASPAPQAVPLSGPFSGPSSGGPLGHDAPARPPRQPPRSAAVRDGAARARIREAPGDAAVIGAGEPLAPAASPRQHHYDPAAAPDMAQAAGVGMPDRRAEALAQAAARVPQQADRGGQPVWRAARAALRLKLPFAAPHHAERPRSADGRRNCGSLEAILWRQWDTATAPPAEVVTAIDRLADLPERIKQKLAAGLDWIFVGPGGVPELDEMTGLRGVRLPSGQATWDACAGAYGERKIVVGSRPSPTPDVMCHEIGHALDDLDSPPGKWQSDSAEFRMLYDQCQPHLASDFHRQPGGLGRKEFFADAFAAIASSQRPALVDMLSGDTRTALRVMLYFNRRYGI